MIFIIIIYFNISIIIIIITTGTQLSPLVLPYVFPFDPHLYIVSPIIYFVFILVPLHVRLDLQFFHNPSHV